MEMGAFVSAYDPMVTEVRGVPALRITSDPYEASRGADAIVLATEWPSLLTLDLDRLREVMRGDVFFDGRNVFDPKRVGDAGFHYLGIGRPFAGVDVKLADGAVVEPAIVASSATRGTE